VKYGKTGFLVGDNDPAIIADSVCHLFENPKMAEEVGDKGCQKIEGQFGLDKMVTAYLQLYEYTIVMKSK